MSIALYLCFFPFIRSFHSVLVFFFYSCLRSRFILFEVLFFAKLLWYITCIQIHFSRLPVHFSIHLYNFDLGIFSSSTFSHIHFKDSNIRMVWLHPKNVLVRSISRFQFYFTSFLFFFFCCCCWLLLFSFSWNYVFSYNRISLYLYAYCALLYTHPLHKYINMYFCCCSFRNTLLKSQNFERFIIKHQHACTMEFKFPTLEFSYAVFLSLSFSLSLFLC